MAYSVSYLFSHPVNISFFRCIYFRVRFFPSSVAYLFGTVACKFKRVCVCACVFSSACARLNVCKRWQSMEEVALMAYIRFLPLFSSCNILFLPMHLFSGFFLFPSSVAYLFGTVVCTSKRVCVCACVFACACANI